MNARTTKAVANYERDILRFRKASRQWPRDKAKYLQAIDNLRQAIASFKAGRIKL